MKQTQTTINYQQQANEFLKITGVSLDIDFLKTGKHFEDDKEVRDIYKCTLKRGGRSYSFNFGQSLAKSQHYLDIRLKRTYTMTGGALNSNYKIVNLDYLKNNPEFKIIKGEAPTSYDILACLTKYDPGTFENFCSEFGYDTDSRKAEKIYHAVKAEYLGLCSIFSEEEMRLLSEIQ